MSILSAFLESDASPIRSFILSQLRQNQPDLLTLLIQRFLNEPDSGLLSQICDVIRFITDGRNQGGQMNDYEASLDFFYSTHSKLLFEPIMNLDSEQFKNSDGKARLILDKDLNIRINLILEILNFNIVSHVYRSKYNIIDSNISVKIAVLLRSSEGYIRLSALRYFKTIIGMKDEFYNRHLIKFDIFNEIVTALVNTKSKYNLFNSACLNLFHFIYEENIKSLIKYICEKYGSVLKEITYVKTFTDMINRHAKSIGGDSGDKEYIQLT